MQSAVTAVSKLNNSEFDGRLIHVCHRGELEVEHSCVKELKDLVSSGLPSCINSKKSSEVRSLYSVVKPTFPGLREMQGENKTPMMPSQVFPKMNESDKKFKEESNVSVVPKQTFSVVKSMSNNIQCYVLERLNDKLGELLEYGGNIEWRHNSIIVTGIDKKVFDIFDQQYLSSLGESVDYMSSDNWNKIISVSANATSFVSQLVSNHLELKIILDHKKRSVTIVGPNETVVKVRNKMLDKIYSKLSLLEYQMLVLLKCMPNMVKDIATKYSTTVCGFTEHSTCLTFDGANIQQAHKYVVDQIALCKSRELPCNMDTSLVVVAINHLKKVGIAVVVCNSNRQRLLPILLNRKASYINLLVVHSLLAKEIDCAINVIENPYKRELVLPSKDILPKLQEFITEYQSSYSLYLQASVSRIAIQGYVEKNVIKVSNKLQQNINDLKVKTLALNLSKEELQFLNHIMYVKPTKKGAQVLSVLSKSLSVTKKNTPVSIELTGTNKAIADSKKHINQELLKNFQVKAVSSRCHPNFLSQIDEFVRKPLEEELNVVVYCFQVRGSEKYTYGNITVTTYTKVYSTDGSDFLKACNVITKLDPGSHFYLLTAKEFEYISNRDNNDLSAISKPYRVKVELQHSQVGVVLHALTKKEADDCYHSLKQHISSNLKLVIYIEVTALQLKFLCLYKPELIRLLKVQSQKTLDSIAKLKLEGKKSQVESLSIVVKNSLSRIVTRSHRCVHQKYLLMWKKCWKSVSETISSNNKELLVELNTSVSGGSITCEIVVVGEDVIKVQNAMYSANRIDGSVRECVIPTDAMGIKIIKEGLSSSKVKLNSKLLFHWEVKGNDIIIASPYSTHVDEVRKTFNYFLASEKEKRKVVKRLFEFKHSFSTKKAQSKWNEVLELAKSHKILSVSAVNEPCGGIEVKGTESVIKQAEPYFLKYISSLENDITCSELAVDYLSHPALCSAEFVQLCKELQSDLPVSLTVQFQPEVLSSASVPGCDVTVDICEGSITLENSDVFINFTDENLTMCKELKDFIGKTAVLRCENYVKHYGHSKVGKAIGFQEDHKVIHAVMPKWFHGNSEVKEAIVSVVVDSLRLVTHFNASSVSLPVLSCIDKNFPIDALAKACLSSINRYCVSSNSLRKIRIVLPIDMAKAFQSELVGGTFHKWVIESKCGKQEDYHSTAKSVEPVWLWKDNDGKFYTYKPEENRILNERQQAGSSFNLRIGRFEYEIDFATMTQTNKRTKKVRQVQCVTGNYVWLFKNDQNKWQRFSPSDSMDIEVMYITKARNSMTINGQRCTYHFSSMQQLNEDHPYSVTNIKRIAAASITDTEQNQCLQKSRILIYASPSDRRNVEERLRSCLKMLKATKSVDIPKKMISVLDKHVKQIQRDYRVEISSGSTITSSSEGPVKYNITGYKENVQEATTAVYQLLATTSNATIQQTFPKPAEWEPQTDPIELKSVTEGSSEWDKILHRVRDTMPGANIKSIKRIQNEFLWEKYCQHKERMSRKGLERVNEKELFHGSSSTAPEEIYKSEEGFDMRFSRQGMWGQGNYFAESAQYSSSYAYKSPSTDQSLYHQLFGSLRMYSTQDNTRQMFLVKVLTGDSLSSPPDKTLRMPPYKPSISSEKIHYDTVNGMAPGSKVYITYSNDKAYPLYLISL